MNVLSKITVNSLKKNKTRTIVTIIGIILSTAMICAVTTFASSLLNYGKECAIFTEGNWHTRELNADYKTYEDLAKDEAVENTTYLQQIGYSDNEKTSTETKPYIYVVGAKKDAEDFLPIHVTSGKYPANSSEIILPKHLYTDGGVKHEIGDTITLDLGKRMLNGDSLPQSEPCTTYTDQGLAPNGEVLEKQETREYKVVGFYERFSNSIEDFQAPGYTAITIADSNPSQDYKYDVYVCLNNPKDTQEFIDNNNLSSDVNTELLMFSGVFMVESILQMLYALAAIIILLIMLGSIALIYNAFSISVSERTKQFGLLSSVGATKKQIRHMVLFEAFSVSAIGIPLGIIFGIAGIGVTLLLIGSTFSSMGVPVELTLSVSPASVIIAIIIALITVYVSVWVPSKRATKTSAIDAIRQSADITTKGKNIRTSKLVSKLFGVPGVIADKHYKRNRKKYRTTVLSLFLSIVLFVSASAFTEYLMGTVMDTSHVTSCELGISVDPSLFTKTSPKMLCKQMKSANGVTDIAYTQSLYLPVQIDTKYLSDEGAQYVEEMRSENSDFDLSLEIKFVDDDSYKALLKKHGLSEQIYMNPENPVGIAVDGVPMYNPETNRQEKVYLLNGDSFELSVQSEKEVPGYFCMGEEKDDNGNTVIIYQKNPTQKVEGEDRLYFSHNEVYKMNNLKIGKVIDEIPFFMGDVNSTSLIYPYSLADSVIEDFVGSNVNFNYYVKSDNHTESSNKIEAILVDNDIKSSYITDYAQIEETRRNSVAIINIFAYGFVILISLIAVANVFNTISTNVSLRRKEFAILKSIGMTRKDFNKMMNFECLLYGSRALIYGLPVSVLVTYLIYRSVAQSVDMAFHLPWGAIGIAVLSVFLVVFVTMLYSMRKIKKDNPIDALKNENI